VYPNVILVILDSARRDAFGAYGATGGLTPNFDRLASEGALLWDHQAAGSGSAQAHVSTFSGQHSARHRMVHNLCDVPPDLWTLSSMLKGLGYSTYGHSKASFIPPAGHEDLFQFDELVYPGKATVTRAPGSMRDSGLDLLRKWPAAFNGLKSAYRAIAGRERQVEAAARYFDGHSSFRYLRDRLIAAKGKAPVFAYTTVLHPHTPYFPPRAFRQRVMGQSGVHPGAIDIQLNFHGYMNGDLGEAPEAMAALQQLYLADLCYGDDQLGVFTKELADAGVLDNSILIVTSDHGEMFGEHGIINHGATVWRELFETPCLIRYPKVVPAGTVVRRLTSALDFVPTVLSWIGQLEAVRGTTPFDGQPVCLDPGTDDRALVLDSPPAVLPERFKKFPNTLYKLSVLHRAVRTSEYKYHWISNGERYLWPVGVPETPDASRLAAEPGVADALHRRMEAFYEAVSPGYNIREYPVAISKSVGARMTNPVVREELKRLGYM